VEIVGIALGAAAIVLTVGVEALKRPRLQIQANEWRPAGPVGWTLAEAHVRVRPLPRWLQTVLVRGTAANCTARITFKQNGQQVLPTIDGRWSGRPQPIKRDHYPSVGTVYAQFDPEQVPQSKSLDLVPGRLEGIAVAVLRHDGTASMFGAESYAGGIGWKHPGWDMQHGVYDVELHVEGAGVSTARFKLEFFSPDFSQFHLRAP